MTERKPAADAGIAPPEAPAPPEGFVRIEEFRRFRNQVATVLRTQARYFSTRDREVLVEAKSLERDLRGELDRPVLPVSARAVVEWVERSDRVPDGKVVLSRSWTDPPDRATPTAEICAGDLRRAGFLVVVAP